MTKVWLVLTFFLADSGEAVYIDGWMPREQPSYEVCLERLEFFENYAKTGLDLPETYSRVEAHCEVISE